MKALREKYQSKKSELISFAKLLSAYFSFVNSEDEGPNELDWKEKELKIEQFCAANRLHLKQIKEVHFLCLQLETMMREEVLLNGKMTISKQFVSDSFDIPSE